MITTAPSVSFEARVQNFPTGLAGTVGVRILDNAGGTTTARATAGITENPAGSGSYVVTLTAPATAGQYSVFWDTGTVGPTTTAAEDLVVSYSAATVTSPAGTDLCALADVRAQLELRTSDTSRDTLISALIPHATMLISQDVEREFASALGTGLRTFPLTWRDRTNASTVFVDLAPFDLQNATLVRLNPEATSPTTLVADTDYMLEPQISPEGVYTSLRLSRYLVSVSQLVLRFDQANIEITGTWGFPSIPVDVKITCAQVVAAWLRRDVPNLGMNLGELEPVPPTIGATFDLPLFAKRNLNRYRRNVGAF